jgi:hypothetical protein
VTLTGEELTRKVEDRGSLKRKEEMILDLRLAVRALLVIIISV